MMSSYSDKFEQVQVIINCPHLVAQLCTREDFLAHDLGAPGLCDVMSYNSHNTCITFYEVFLRRWVRGLVQAPK